MEMPKSRVRGVSSERIAKALLERLGYEILETNKIVKVDEREVFEVDMVAADPSGVKCCVEVKAGRAGVSDLRQLFADSRILGLKPLMVCKGLADEAAKAVARELGVKVIELSNYYLLLEPEELNVIVRDAVRGVLNEYGFYPTPPLNEINREDWKIIETVSESESMEEAASTLGMEVKDLGHKIGKLRQRGVIPGEARTFKSLRSYLRQLLSRYAIIRRLEEIEEEVKKMEELLRNLKKVDW